MDRISWNRIKQIPFIFFVVVGMILVFALLNFPNEYSSIKYDIEDNTQFSGIKAYQYLEHLVNEYPNRSTGSQKDEEAARWIMETFEGFDLQVSTQEFESMGLLPSKGFKKFGVINVLGLLPGQSDEIILIGAHRDVVPQTIQGAEDNGSGTAVLLELARNLTQRDNYYTYLFASFGGEETGLMGSQYLAHNYPDPISLMLNFDMVGLKNAEKISSYRSPILPLHLNQLLKQISDNYPDYQWNAEWEGIGKILSVKFESTDTTPFILSNTPTSSFTANGPHKMIHSEDDTLDVVSAVTLGKAGRVAERIIRTIDQNHISLNGNLDYLLKADTGYIPGWRVKLVKYYWFILFGLLYWSWPLLKSKDRWDWKQYLKPSLVAVSSGLFIALVLETLIFSANPALWKLLILALTLIGGTQLRKLFEFDQLKSCSIRLTFSLIFLLYLYMMGSRSLIFIIPMTLAFWLADKYITLGKIMPYLSYIGAILIMIPLTGVIFLFDTMISIPARIIFFSGYWGIWILFFIHKDNLSKS